MQARNTTSPKLTSILKPALAALPLFVLLMKLDESLSHLANALGTAEWFALDLVPYFVAVATRSFAVNGFGHLLSASCPLQMLASRLPLHVLFGLA